MQAEILWLMAAKTKWQESEARKQESEAALKAGDEKLAAQLLAQSQELLGAARGILYSANIANPGVAPTLWLPVLISSTGGVQQLAALLTLPNRVWLPALHSQGSGSRSILSSANPARVGAGDCMQGSAEV